MAYFGSLSCQREIHAFWAHSANSVKTENSENQLGI